VIVDSYGRSLLRSQEDGAPLGAAEVERQQRFEREMATRVVALLEPVVGVDRVRVNVAARLTQESEDRIEEQWDHNSVVRSQASSPMRLGRPARERHRRLARQPSRPRPPGSNVPPSLQPPRAERWRYRRLAGAAARPPTTKSARSCVTRCGREATSPGCQSRSSSTTSTSVRREDGQLVGSTKSREAAQMTKIQALVAAAVGLDSSRGDQLTVENPV